MDKITKYLRNLKQNDPHKFAELLMRMDDKELEILQYDWNIWARDKQLAPEGKWRYWVVLGGRSSGKSRTGSEWIIQRAREGKGPIALIGQTASDVRDIMIEVGPSSIMSVCPPDFKPTYEPSKRRLTFPNGVICTTFSGDEPGQLKGPQHQTVWCDELPKYSDPQATFDEINFSTRIGDSRVLYSTTPTPHAVIKQLWTRYQEDPEGRIRLVVMPTKDNAANIDPEFIKDLDDSYKGTRLYRQEVLGEILWDSPDALFTPERLDEHRVHEAPNLDKVIVSVDIAVTNKSTSDSTGIIVGGRGKDDGHGYCLFDGTMKANPLQWARRVIDLYDEYNAEYVACEVNQGGDLIETTLHQVRPGLPVKKITAKESKTVRMEPVSLLEEQGKIHLVGHFPELEDQLVQFTGKKGQRSPDRYDSFSMCMADLLLTKKRGIVRSQEFYL